MADWTAGKMVNHAITEEMEKEEEGEVAMQVNPALDEGDWGAAGSFLHRIAKVVNQWVNTPDVDRENFPDLRGKRTGVDRRSHRRGPVRGLTRCHPGILAPQAPTFTVLYLVA